MLVHASHRSLFARAALAEILRTMSFALHEANPLEIGLLGKTPGETSQILADPESIRAMRLALAGFADFINAH